MGTMVVAWLLWLARSTFDDDLPPPRLCCCRRPLGLPDMELLVAPLIFPSRLLVSLLFDARPFSADPNVDEVTLMEGLERTDADPHDWSSDMVEVSTVDTE